LNIALKKGLANPDLPVEIMHEDKCAHYDGECCDCMPTVLICCGELVLSIKEDGSGVPLLDGKEMAVN
jgi:hypothetical protein